MVDGIIKLNLGMGLSILVRIAWRSKFFVYLGYYFDYPMLFSGYLYAFYTHTLMASQTRDELLQEYGHITRFSVETGEVVTLNAKNDLRCVEFQGTEPNKKVGL
jgi:hypothetical protein